MAAARTAVVTGAGTGVGKAVALALAANGWNVAMAGRRTDVLEQAAAETENSPGTAIAAGCDVTVPDDVDALFAKAASAFGRVDLLFNNAGASLPSMLIDDMPVEKWKQIIDVNLTGSFLCARAAFAAMRRQDPMGGRIINNGSVSAYVPRPGSVAYTASKHAITGLTRTLALDGRPFNIACGQLDIGNAASDMTARMGDGVPQASGELAPEPTFDVAHVGASVLHMANLPLDTNVLFMTVMATNMPYAGRG